jgi:hypothetical protein
MFASGNVCARRHSVVRVCSLLLVATVFTSITHAFECSPIFAGKSPHQRHAPLKRLLNTAAITHSVPSGQHEGDKQVEMDNDIPTLHRPFAVRSCQKNSTRHENLCLRRLSARVHKLETVLDGVLSAIMSADDIAFGERRATSMGDVYMDASLAVARRPRWLRRSIQDVLDQHNFPVSPPETHWHPGDVIDELDGNR